MTYVDTHPLHGAFIANSLRRLIDLIGAQGEIMLQDAGIEFPPRTVSSVLLIGERGKISAADIAKNLNEPHQLVTQRIDLLITLGIIERREDPSDKRRKTISLTPKGITQFQSLQKRLAEADVAFSNLYAEIDCDLPTVTLRMLDALESTSILDRVKSAGTSTGKPDNSIKKETIS